MNPFLKLILMSLRLSYQPGRLKGKVSGRDRPPPVRTARRSPPITVAPGSRDRWAESKGSQPCSPSVGMHGVTKATSTDLGPVPFLQVEGILEDQKRGSDI
jgi:hypothetical protein